MASDAPVSRRARRRGRGWFVLADLARLLATWLVSTLLLLLADALLPDLEASSLGSIAAVAAVSGLVGSLVRPLLVEVSVRLGWLTVLPLAFCAQAVVLHIAILLVPGITATWRPARATFSASVSISPMRAEAWASEVWIGSCQPSQLRAGTPIACNAIASRPLVTCSPEATTTSYSRGS